MLHMSAHGIHALPASNRVGPDNRMHSLEISPHILRRTTGLRIDLEPIQFRRLVEPRLLERSSQPLQKLLIRLRDAIIDLVSRTPEGITACLGQLYQTERSIVGRDRLKGNVGVPLRGVLLLGGQLFGLLAGPVTVELAVLDGRDGGYFGVVAPQLAVRVEDRVDVQTGGGGAAGELAEAED